MSQLSVFIAEAKEGLLIGEPIPKARWETVAKRCRSEEIADIKTRIDGFKVDLAAVEQWDGDTQDEINIAISQFSRLLSLAVDNGSP